MPREQRRSREMRRAPSGRAARALAALIALVVVGSGCKPLDDAMVAIFGRSMRDSRALDPYEQPLMPAENAVPFASGNYPAQLGDVGLGQAEPAAYAPPPPFTPQDMTPPGSDLVRNLENPVPATEESLARGQVMYDRFCTVCHGPQGVSADAPIAEKLPVVAAWNLATGASAGYSDGYVYGMIRRGRGVMPGYGHRISHFDRWHIVNYVRRLQQQAPGGGAPDGAPAEAGSGAAGADTAADADTAGAGG